MGTTWNVHETPASVHVGTFEKFRLATVLRAANTDWAAGVTAAPVGVAAARSAAALAWQRARRAEKSATGRADEHSSMGVGARAACAAAGTERHRPRISRT